MKWKNIGIMSKLSVGFGIIFIIFATYAYYNYESIARIRTASRLLDQLSTYQETLLKAEIAHHLWVEAVASYIIDDTVTGVNVTDRPRECSFGKWYYGQERRILESLAPEVITILSNLETSHNNLHGALSNIKDAGQRKDLLAAQTIYREQVAHNLELIRKGLSSTREALDTHIAKASGVLATTFQSVLRMTLIVSACILAGCVALAIFLGRSIALPLRALAAYAADVAGGNLRQPRLVQDDETGQLSKALGVMVSKLKETIDEARQQTENATAKGLEAENAMRTAEAAAKEASAKNATILDAAQKIERVVNTATAASCSLSTEILQSHKGSEVQAGRIAQTVTAMEQMNIAVLEVTNRASGTADMTAIARGKAENGAEVVMRVVDSILRVRDQSRQLKEDMQTLGQHAQSVSRIMGVISEIADQTNLLALNAAIEAARAGDAGKGFAVVADEVRKLAEKTMASTMDVDNAIKAIQSSADKSMRQVDGAVTIIEETTELANTSGSALREIVSMVDGAAGQIRSIATASEEQAASSREITTSVSEINTVATQTALSMLHASKAVDELAEQIGQLNTLITNLRKG